MILFYNHAAKHLADKLKVRKGKFTVKKFSDGEIYVKVNENVRNKEVWVLASSQSPSDNLIEMLFIIDALERNKAKVNLIVTYLSYARQDLAKKGESLSCEVICSMLNHFKFKKIYVLHEHSERLKKFLKYKSIIPINYSLISEFDLIASADKGSQKLVKDIGSKINMNTLFIEKKRLGHEKIKSVRIKGDIGKIKDKKVIIIDDIIATGNTILEAGNELIKNGAKEVCVYATHGILSGEAIKNIEKSRISKVYITNSLNQNRKEIIKSKKINVVDISKDIGKIIKQRK